MPHPRIYFPQPLEAGQRITLDEAPFRHVIQVLRMGSGDKLTLFGGFGIEHAVQIETVGKRDFTVMVLSADRVDRESPLQVILAQAVAKGERMDFAIQKSVELGATGIMPLITERCAVHLSAERWERKVEHWQSVVLSACEQSGRNRIPKVAPVTDFRDWLSHAPAKARKLVLDPGAAATKPLTPTPKPSMVVLLIGPEGGFTDIEVKLAEVAGFEGVNLGPRILRTETAGLVALSVVQALWGDFAVAAK